MLLEDVARMARETGAETGRTTLNPRVMEALGRVARHRLVPADDEGQAYRNSPLSIGFGQTISQPFIVALMTDLLELKAGDKVLEVGTGSGYQAAVLAELGARVYTTEIIEELGRAAQERLSALGYDAIVLRIGDGSAGWPEQAPFDGIVVTAAPPAVRPVCHARGPDRPDRPPRPDGPVQLRGDTVTYDLPPELAVEADGQVRTVLINRPEQLNAVNQPLHWALANVWRQLAADAGARVVILTGAGRAFSAGGDLDWITTFLDDPVARDESLREGAQIIEELLRFPLPVIAAVNGPAVGLGCSLAVLCDIVLISQAAHLADPHVSVGLVAGDGGAACWPPLTPILRSREYLYTGDRIPAATAVELGLATRVTAPEDLMPEARRLAVRLASQPAEAIQGTKRVVNLHLSQALSGAMQSGFAAEAGTMRSAEHRDRLLALRRSATR